MANSRMQIVPVWPGVQFACVWQPLRYNLYATGGHSGTIYMRLAASSMQTLHALAASCVQSRQFFASTPSEVSLLNYISSGVLWRICCQTGIYAGFLLLIINFAVRISEATMRRGHSSESIPGLIKRLQNTGSGRKGT